MKRSILFATALCVLLFTTSCGSGSPSSPTPTIAQIAGVWRVTVRATSISSTECVGQLLNAAGGVGSTDNRVAQISQTGSNVNATITENDTGAATTYSGTVGASTLALTYQSCNLCVVRNFQCAAGVLRDVTPQADSVNANVAGNTMTGTEAVTYTVTVSSTGAAAGLLIINYGFSATKQ